MRTDRILLPAILVFALACSAHALEPSGPVKVSTVLKAEASWDGKPIVYPEGKPEITGMVVEIAPGGETGWHLHPVPSFGMMLEGELEIELKTGEVKRLKAGETLAEVTNTLHNGRNIGLGPVRIVVFYAGVVGQKLSVKEGGQ